ncbi:non-heme iron oxygenase ferredoxin subunit [Lipingzhangella sp. LS1_29]|uniref:Non-heme iron oxygenase ferredoxin subunit n=1 Tax=Lipingzhangella rawalii TaxID=2055835 RepID=A0ABU2H0D5_9ACTN|nr:non-heme iron oxygenase ferredoxin subunit [Lipingzhangella rawalii]MDS1268766.1 non-heme iron oxygenase ferredoxin subunit [Lipingzhangella rawalii]
MSEEFVRACSLSDLPEQGALSVEIGSTPIALARSDGEVYAVRDVCSHAEVALSEGEVEDGTIECWLHGSCFDLSSGAAINPPATKPVPTYPVKIDGEDVLVSVATENA